MYTQVASKLVVVSGAAEYSQAVSMAGANAIQVDFTVMSGTGTVSAEVEISNDLENWDTSGTTITSATAGPDFETGDVPGIAAQYVRIKWTTSTGTSVVSGGINTANL